MMDTIFNGFLMGIGIGAGWRLVNAVIDLAIYALARNPPPKA